MLKNTFKPISNPSKEGNSTFLPKAKNPLLGGVGVDMRQTESKNL